ncbi:Neutral endopeptidase [Emticicia aquatica]|uniref:Neutral endopeptidase n=1 Tax=Emticicia aquatica TaxID=1681835 RepID=A0ABN8EZ53_9BACT|nr:M13 family metallopeptidase [Emticicia aquatica]CAH0997158.1 Neutral endopeptidase [Emticicia aquatica]
MPAKPSTSKPDVLEANIDTTVNVATDFFQYANGGWIKKNPIPDVESAWGIGNLVIEENLKRLKEINEKAMKENAEKGTTSQKIGDFWQSAMDSSTIEKQGISPLKPELDAINSIADLKSLQNVLADLTTKGVGGMIGTSINQDAKKSDLMAVHLWQTGLGLPERDYYFKSDTTSIRVRNEYVKHITKMFQLMGEKEADAMKIATTIMAMETRMAKASRKLEDLRDPYANYNKMPIKNLYKLAPSIEWNTYFGEIGIKKLDSVIVGQPEFYVEIEKMLKESSINDWKNYLRWNLIGNYASSLSSDFDNQNFYFYRTVLNGVKAQKPRWKRVIRQEEGIMGELMGQLFVKEFFNETAKKRYSDMVETVKNVYAERIKNLTWMSDVTKKKALQKLSTIKKKVGYPDKWKDFSSLEITKDSYARNVIRASQWWHNYSVNKLGKPVDRDEWDMTPQTYNAYYNPSNNEIVLPAGIFTVPGYRDEELDDATVYGYGGASTIGHEITHGFDDEGRQFDETGNLKSWWTNADEVEFKKRADVMVNQFNNTVVVDGIKINGKATLGENIADLGGVLLGLDAFKKTEQFKKNEKIAGFSPTQRYFMGYALGWLGHERKESLKEQLQSDVHSPSKNRVNNIFVNVDEFYSAFGVKPTDKMYIAPEKRVRIW